MLKLSLNEVSQFAHVGWGGFMMLSLVALHVHPLLAIVNVIIFAAIKEFIWDKLMEDKATQGSDIEDFSYFLIGIGVASVVLLFGDFI